MTQIGFTRDQAHEALDEILNGERCERWIAAGQDLDADALLYLVPADRMEEMRKGHENWLDSEEFSVDHGGEDLPPGYHPWHHSPLATTDRLLPAEPLYPSLSRYIYGRGYEDLDDQEQGRVFGAALNCLLRVRLDPDGQGAVPILSVGHSTDDPGGGLRWQLGFVTEVPGLFTRVSANGFFGEEWAVVTGSGYRLHGGWHSKDGAATCAAALGRVLPNVDWMRLVPDNFTPAAKAAIAATVRRYGPWCDADPKEPDPEQMTEAVPADSSLPEPQPATSAAE